MQFNLQEFLTLTFTLFAVIDVIGSIPMLISIKQKMGTLNPWRVTLISGSLMVLFFFGGKPFLNLLGVDIKSFAVAGSIVIFILGLEMVLGIEFFKAEKGVPSGTLVPIAFPLIAGSGTLTTIMSLKATFERADKNEYMILLAIVINLAVIYFVLRSLNLIERALGKAGLMAVRKFFGVILLAIAVKVFATNASGLIK
ncbi:MAG: MarC family protein [Chitinophagaceae bacterium]|jgi:multiple antibiotic resistance protein|nr:MarC family protein [Chitinophagaceae bacterium]MBK7680937.1 MarC family protein [Chitinophagaceae bacterium]MBK8300817.1 MarC family protein [Chitinophagaceae bacterium]MBK9465350.1 MarC family protein [Chitinophagaceae bacterium]MBK9938174.1 MarC family protein [Chitinophagaceae bacterium]